MSYSFRLLVVSTFFILANSLGSEDRLFRKYAYLKIYESCFGAEVTKMIRKEVRMATIKCAAAEMPQFPPRTTTAAPPPPPPMQNDAPESDNNVPSFDVEKLHQAIFAYRPNAFPQAQAPAFRPFPAGGVQGFPQAPQFGNQLAFQPAPMFYPGFQQAPQFPGYSFPIVAQPFYNNRVSRDMEFHNENVIAKLGPKTRNITCVMQELGYLDHNLEPNYEKIGERVNNLPISQDLKGDVIDGLGYCQKFAQCLPEVNKKKSPFSSEFFRPTIFFKCYKHKKLEACILNEIRERLENEEDFNDDLELKRAGKSAKFSGEDDISQVAESMAGYWYADDSGMDIDAIL